MGLEVDLELGGCGQGIGQNEEMGLFKAEQPKIVLDFQTVPGLLLIIELAIWVWSLHSMKNTCSGYVRPSNTCFFSALLAAALVVVLKHY